MGSNVAPLSFYVFFPMTLFNKLLQHEGEIHVRHSPVYFTNKMWKVCVCGRHLQCTRNLSVDKSQRTDL